MAKLSIVRHGQASFHGDNYDLLSELGEEQSRKLGDWWLAHGVTFDRVYIGPKLRHRQTYDGVAAVYKAAGKSFPEPKLLPEFDEHQGPSVVKKVLSGSTTGEPTMGMLPKNLKGREAIRHYFARFQEITSAWVQGEIEAPEFESWQTFRDRVTKGMDLITCDEARHTVVFTSGGPVSVSAGIVLGLEDAKIMELSWNVNNIATAEFLYKGGRTSLLSFNGLPHLDDPKYVTLV